MSPNGIVISQTRLTELRRQCRHHNIFPIFLPNAFYDQKPAAVYRELEPLVTEIADQFNCLLEEELMAEIRSMPDQLQMLLGEPSKGLYQREFLERAAVYRVVWLSDDHYCDFKSALQKLDANSEVGIRFPEILEHVDEDGLLVLSPLFELHDGGIIYGDYVLHYHQCLRRGFSSNPNFTFLSRFAAYYRAAKSENMFRIAIDHRRVMHKSEFQRMMEFDSWYGPLFDESKLDDLEHSGLTVIERERPSLFDFSSRIDRTEFYWTADRNTQIKTLEIEELPSVDVSYEGFRISRYVHSERDVAEKRIRHFDGAAKIYDSKGHYEQRYAKNIPKEPRADRKPKLFRIDGDIAVTEWAELIGMFFKSNEMVLRYFDPEKYESSFRQQIEAVAAKSHFTK